MFLEIVKYSAVIFLINLKNFLKLMELLKKKIVDTVLGKIWENY